MTRRKKVVTERTDGGERNRDAPLAILCAGSGLAPSHACRLRLMPGSLVSIYLWNATWILSSRTGPGLLLRA